MPNLFSMKGKGLLKITALFLSISMTVTSVSYAAPSTQNKTRVQGPGYRVQREQKKEVHRPCLACRQEGTIDHSYQKNSEDPNYGPWTMDHGQSKKLLIPKNLGQIDESYQGRSGRTVIYIQDVHDSLEAQVNIAKIIHHLVDRYGVQTVFEEGYEGPVPTNEYFNFIKDPVERERFAYFLMDQLRLSGAEYAHITRKVHRPWSIDHSEKQSADSNYGLSSMDYGLVGADNIQAHLENVKAYQQSGEVRSEIEKDLRGIQKLLSLLADKHFTPEMKRFMKLRDRFHGEKLQLPDYLNQIAQLDSAAVRSFPGLQLILDAQKSSDPKLVHALESLSGAQIFQSLRQCERILLSKILDSKRNRETYEWIDRLNLLDRLSRVKISCEEYLAVRDLLNNIRTQELADFLASATGKPIVLSKKWEHWIRQAARFYEIAGRRDHAIEVALAKHSAKRRAQSDKMNLSINAMRYAPCAMQILVFGGFHKEAIKEILKRRGDSFVIITPKISAPSKRHEEYYRQLMSGQFHPFEKSLGFLRTAARAPGAYELYSRSGIRSVYQFEKRSGLRGDSIPQTLSRRMGAFDSSTAHFRQNPNHIKGRSEMRSGGTEIYRGGKEWITLSDQKPLALLDEHGNYLVTDLRKSKDEVHRDGDWHETAHIYLMDQQGRIWLQRRSENLKTSPGKIQVSASGHVDFGETADQAAVREGQEELGITIDERRLIKTGIRMKRDDRKGAMWNREFSSIYIYVMTPDEEVQVIQNYNLHEVSDFWVFESNERLLEKLKAEPDLFSGTLRHVFLESPELGQQLTVQVQRAREVSLRLRDADPQSRSELRGAKTYRALSRVLNRRWEKIEHKLPPWLKPILAPVLLVLFGFPFFMAAAALSFFDLADPHYLNLVVDSSFIDFMTNQSLDLLATLLAPIVMPLTYAGLLIYRFAVHHFKRVEAARTTRSGAHFKDDTHRSELRGKKDSQDRPEMRSLYGTARYFGLGAGKDPQVIARELTEKLHGARSMEHGAWGKDCKIA